MKFFIIVALLGVTSDSFVTDECRTEEGIRGKCEAIADCPYVLGLVNNITLVLILKQYGGCGEWNGNIYLCCPESSDQTTYPVLSAPGAISPLYGENDLFNAVEEGNLTQTAAILKAGVDVNAKSSLYNGSTALILAALNGHISIVEALLKAGAALESTTYLGRTPLFVASLNGQVAIVQTLLKARADVNLRGYDGMTALMAASAQGHLPVVETLFEAGAIVNSKMNDGTTALALAANHGQISVVQALIKAGADINTQQNNGASPLYLAAAKGHTSVVQDLLNAGANLSDKLRDGSTALLAAAAEDHIPVVETLVKAGADINSAKNDGTTAIEIAKLNRPQRIVENLEQLEASKSRCKDGWLYFEGSCYFFSFHDEEFMQGRQKCLGLGSDYVKVSTESEWNFIRGQVTTNTWIGLSDLEKEGTLKWISDGTIYEMNKTWWHPNQPDDDTGTEDCIHIWTTSGKKLLNDGPCEFPKLYICENMAGLSIADLEAYF